MLRKIRYIFILLLAICACNHNEGPSESIPEPEVRPGMINRDVKSFVTTQGAINQICEEKFQKKTTKEKKRKRAVVNGKIPTSSLSQPVLHTSVDTIMLKKLKQLHMEGLELDLNEPQTRDYLFLPYDSLRPDGYIALSREVFLKINFDNDILNNTDRFYTNGISIEIITPSLKAFPLTFLMLPYWGSGVNFYGLTIVQNMYTPSTTKIGGILYGDRPYAAYLYLGTIKITNDLVKRFRQTAELDLGVIGPYSFGGFVQKSFHASVPTNNEPLGWLYQIKNDLVLNYSVCFEKGFVSKKNLDLNIYGYPSLGTLYTNIRGGVKIRGGRLNPYFVNLGLTKAKFNRQQGLLNTQIFIFLNLEGKAVGYDATLQGGLFNKSSIYKIRSEDISRFVFEGNLGLTLVHGGFRFEIGQHLLSPEFHHGWWHHWVHTGLTFSL